MFRWIKNFVSPSEEVVRDDSFSFGPVKAFDDDEDDTTHNTGVTNHTDLLGKIHSYDMSPNDHDEDDEDGHGYEFELLVRAYMRDNHYQSRHQVRVYVRGMWSMYIHRILCVLRMRHILY
jgi:hypothetical protein